MLTAEQLDELRATPHDGANRVRLARQFLKVTQLDVEAATALKQSFISAIENGKYSDLPLETSRRLARYFGCAIEDLFPARRDEGQPQPTLPFVARERAAAAR